MLQSIKTIKFSVKDIVVPLWQGAENKFGGQCPLCPPQKAYELINIIIRLSLTYLVGDKQPCMNLDYD